MNKMSIALALAGAALLGGCASSNYAPVESPTRLQVAFADPAWDGQTVPAGQRCRWAGGHGSTPRLLVSNIPSGANALVVEFSDRSYFLMDHGGHGKIGLWLSGAPSSITIPSVAGESLELPVGMFVEKEHQGWLRGNGGAYLPPCSGGRGHRYYATVKAVYKAKAAGEQSRLLGEQIIEMGKY
ncbi:hypothetical protein KRX52_17305 [Pseudomonas sp. MAP12]|uniref:Lipoprotein n=1 Tax=Geopseudomonas aromaticivorans TaxID=2849492 RepID=A0ABS6N0G2_9GAMM|nr:hypothetical protein [Pseudomonas aromaticivorans]MBV2134538.1 hypothetical protein [Pseudomonas aromaticivorans]